MKTFLAVVLLFVSSTVYADLPPSTPNCPKPDNHPDWVWDGWEWTKKDPEPVKIPTTEDVPKEAIIGTSLSLVIVIVGMWVVKRRRYHEHVPRTL